MAAAPPQHFADVAPVLAVRDLAAALERFERLGFEVSTHAGGGYGFAHRDEVWLHLAELHDLDPGTTTSACYLYVADADALFAEWQASGVDGRFHPPEDTDYGLRELAYVDPDGILLRAGAWLSRPAPGS